MVVRMRPVMMYVAQPAMSLSQKLPRASAGATTGAGISEGGGMTGDGGESMSFGMRDRSFRSALHKTGFGLWLLLRKHSSRRSSLSVAPAVDMAKATMVESRSSMNLFWWVYLVLYSSKRGGESALQRIGWVCR